MLFATACARRRRLQEDEEWTQVDSLPMDGISGGEDYMALLAHLIETKCAVEEVFFEVWKVCPATQA
jgi:hypothetical protein